MIQFWGEWYPVAGMIPWVHTCLVNIGSEITISYNGDEFILRQSTKKIDSQPINIDKHIKIMRNISIGWFKGNITGNPHISWENLWFPVDFPLQ